MPIYPYKDKQPAIHPTAFLAPGARVVGDVAIGPRASLWFNAVARGDSSHVRVGADSNIQDCAVLHTDDGKPCVVEERCTVGHLAIVHGSRIGRGSLIGMGAIVLSGSVIGEESLVAAGTVVPEDRQFPPRCLLVGSPARVARELSDDEVTRLLGPGVETYLRHIADYGPLT